MKLSNYDNKRVLIVDDQEDIHQDFVEMLKPHLIERSTDELTSPFIRKEDPSFCRNLSFCTRSAERKPANL